MSHEDIEPDHHAAPVAYRRPARPHAAVPAGDGHPPGLHRLLLRLPLSWWTIIPVFGAVVIPYMAVVLANVGPGGLSHEVMAIGDNFNNQAMLEYAGQAVVMGNAGAEMLALADEHGWATTVSNDADGVAEMLEPLIGAADLTEAAQVHPDLARKW